MTEPREHCELIRDESGEVVARVRVSDDITDEGRRHLAAIVEAAKRLHADQLAADPTLGERQEAAVRRIRERVRRLRSGRPA